MNNIQQAFLPRRNPQKIRGIEFAFNWRPEEEVGGDYFFTEQDENVITVELGDVEGHGVGAALAMTAINGVFFGLRESNRMPPNRMISVANNFMCKLRPLEWDGQSLKPTDRNMTSSMFVMQIEISSGIVTYTNAGHPPPLCLLSSSEGEAEILPLQSGGLLLGFIEETSFEIGALRLGPNDLVLMYTDGLTEAKNSEGEEFHEAKNLPEILRSLSSDSAEEIVKSITKIVDDFRGEIPLEDDFTLACIKFTENFKRTG